MNGKRYLNGCDYLMLGFDHELRRHGFAGNGCQIVLELGASISSSALEDRLTSLLYHYPILNACPSGFLKPHWKISGKDGRGIAVRVHRNDPLISQALLNEALDIKEGELARFDLIERAGQGTKVIFTWAHPLMDALGAEHFLALVGRPDLPLPANEPPAPSSLPMPLKQRIKLAWKNLHQLDSFCEAPPRGPGIRHPQAPARLQYRVERFSAEETAIARANGAKSCGVLGNAQFHAAVAMTELHRLHERLGCPSPSYVLPMPVGLRPKGTIDPLFSNQVGMLMLQFLPSHLGTVANAVAHLKIQTEQAMREGLLESGRMLSELFRFLPLPTYMAVLKQGLRGEICSLFYGDTAAVTPSLTTFLDAPIEDFAHVAALTPSPGLGVIFCYFRGNLRVTVLHSSKVLDDSEAAEFSASVRARLLNP